MSPYRLTLTQKAPFLFRDLTDDPDDYSPDPELLLDVPFVPTDPMVIEAMLDLAQIRRDDVLYDLGSGEGGIVVAAAMRCGARAIGIEIDPLRIADAMEYAGDCRVEHLVDFIEGDLFTADFSEASIVTLYLLDSINVQLRPRLLSELQAGSRIVSHAFDMGDWKPDEQREAGGVTLYKWTVPAQVAGPWQWEALDGSLYRAELQQSYQQVTGKVWRQDQAVALQHAQLCGAQLQLQLQPDPQDTGTTRCFTLDFKNGVLDAIWEESIPCTSPKANT